MATQGQQVERVDGRELGHFLGGRRSMSYGGGYRSMLLF